MLKEKRKKWLKNVSRTLVVLSAITFAVGAPIDSGGEWFADNEMHASNGSFLGRVRFGPGNFLYVDQASRQGQGNGLKSTTPDGLYNVEIYFVNPQTLGVTITGNGMNQSFTTGVREGLNSFNVHGFGENGNSYYELFYSVGAVMPDYEKNPQPKPEPKPEPAPVPKPEPKPEPKPQPKPSPAPRPTPPANNSGGGTSGSSGGSSAPNQGNQSSSGGSGSQTGNTRNSSGSSSVSSSNDTTSNDNASQSVSSEGHTAASEQENASSEETAVDDADDSVETAEAESSESTEEESTEKESETTNRKTSPRTTAYPLKDFEITNWEKDSDDNEVAVKSAERSNVSTMMNIIAVGTMAGLYIGLFYMLFKKRTPEDNQ